LTARLPLPWLDEADPAAPFPPADHALRQPNGLLAAGGGLEPERLLRAYRAGIFPWYSDGQPILWWSPDPRLVLFPTEFRLHRSLAKVGRQPGWRFTVNCAFEAVLRACAATPRPGQEGTWITEDMLAAYSHLHNLGWVQSLEVWHGAELAGGLYGLRMGGVFFGESMFSRRRDASKLALAALCNAAPANGLALVDCQVVTPHLMTLGARPLPRLEFNSLLGRCIPSACTPHPLALDASVNALAG
jgi:leucyl/phenylalanyl-tRNA--protein transferase